MCFLAKNTSDFDLPDSVNQNSLGSSTLFYSVGQVNALILPFFGSRHEKFHVIPQSSNYNFPFLTIFFPLSRANEMSIIQLQKSSNFM